MNYIHIIPSSQTLNLIHNNKPVIKYTISTAKNGLGEKKGSEKTPTGWHVVRAKIGDGQKLNTVFVSRRPTGEIYSSELLAKEIAAKNPNRDWILTRIFWLSGLEIGKNRLGDVDTMQRYVYIHGSPDSVSFGKPNSRGCVNMKNNDLLDLFAKVPVGTKIFIGDEVYDYE